MSFRAAWRPPAALVPVGGLVTALSVALVNVGGPEGDRPPALALAGCAVGELLVLAGFVAMYVLARDDSRRPLSPGERPRGWLSALAALVPAAVTAGLGAAGLGLLVVLLVAGGVLGSATHQDLVNGTGLQQVLVVLLVGGLVLMLCAAQAVLLGSATGLAVRRAYLARDRQLLLAARESARTRADAVSVQGATPPGRGWRRVGPRLGVALAVVGLLLVRLGHPGAGAVLVVVPVLAALARTWAAGRSPATEAVRAGLRARAGAPPTVDDAALVELRRREMSSFAAAHGWTATPPPAGLLDQVLDQLAASRRNAYRGVLDGTAFLVWDRIRLLTATTSSGRRTSHLSHQATSVDLDFPLVVRLAVVAGSALTPVTWSHVGPRIDLESGEFNDRFDVYCDDPVRARMVLNPAVMGLLLGTPEQVELVLDRGRLTLTAVGTLLPPDRVLTQVALAVRIRDSARSAMPPLRG